MFFLVGLTWKREFHSPKTTKSLSVITARKENKGIFHLPVFSFLQVFGGGFPQKIFHFDGKE